MRSCGSPEVVRTTQRALTRHVHWRSFSATRGLQVEVLLGSGGQQVAAGATAQWRLAVRRDAAVAGGGGGATARPLRRGVVSLVVDTEVLTDINGAIEVKF